VTLEGLVKKKKKKKKKKGEELVCFVLFFEFDSWSLLC
jgi:hypothetical protein